MAEARVVRSLAARSGGGGGEEEEEVERTGVVCMVRDSSHITVVAAVNTERARSFGRSPGGPNPREEEEATEVLRQVCGMCGMRCGRLCSLVSD